VAGGQAVESVVAEGFRETGAGAGLWNINFRNLTLYVFPPLPPRIDLKTGTVRILDPDTFKGQGRTIPGGAATVLDLPLDPAKELQSLTVRALANEVVIGLMAATLAR
jgi:hypothetical protein